MKAEELRIGNYIYYSSEVSKDELMTVSIGTFGLMLYNSDQLSPIPLTEEWLLKFGFESDEITFEFNGFTLGWYKGDKMYYLPTGQISLRHKKEIEYVHQLQNLYFALTGEELTIKESTIYKENK